MSTGGRLAGRVAIVTGGGDGIGRGIVRRFAEEGARVLVAELDQEAGASVIAELATGSGAGADPEGSADLRLVRTDVSREEDNRAMVQAAVEAWGTVDILVNNAWGGGRISRAEHKTDADLDHGLAVGFRGPLWAMQAAFPVMKARRYGRIVNICSLNGVNAHVGTLEYNTAKEALRAATRTVAREWAGTGIVCNAVCPAAKSAAFHRAMAGHPELVAAADAGNPMGRIGDPYEDVAPAVLFLASEESRYVTGNTVFVDGGAHINGVPWAPELPDEP